MIRGKQDKQRVRDYYDQEAGDYIKQYQDDYKIYPANLIRIKLIIERLKKIRAKTVLDAGCGTCGPMIKLIKEGFITRGFDFSKDMVEYGKKELEKAGYGPELITFADLESGEQLPESKFDAILASGVFPHISDEKKALSNIRKILNPKGSVFVEFRNDLFAAYSLNKYSIEFFLNRVIDFSSFSKEIRSEIISFYSKRFKVDKPKEKSGKIKYEDILAKFHNPLTIEDELFKPDGFSVAGIHFYHYHALPPIFEKKYPKLFRKLSFKMEKPNDWKGYLTASAFVVEAKKD